MNKNILITSGATSEHIDQIRVITNISSGKLGARIAEHAMFNYHNVTYIHSGTAIIPRTPSGFYHAYGLKCSLANSTKEVMKAMKKFTPKMDVVIHCMAVSDFSFKQDQNIKLKSNDPQAFVDYMRDNIVVNPKIISHIKEWNPNVFLIGFKFEVGKTHKELINIAYESLQRNNCDLVIANDKVEMNQTKEHIAYAIDKNKKVKKLIGKDAIAEYLVGLF